MPTFAVDSANTFTTLMFMGSAPRNKYNSTVQDSDANGILKWEAQLACVYVPQYGRTETGTLKVVIVSPTDPCEGLTPGPVELVGFRVGVSSPEAREDGEGRAKVIGGKPYFSCEGIHSAAFVPSGRSRD